MLPLSISLHRLLWTVVHVFFSRRHEDMQSCVSAHLSVKVLRSGMLKVTAHATISGDRRVCES